MILSYPELEFTLFLKFNINCYRLYVKFICLL